MVDHQRGADRLAALRAAGPARQHRHALIAADRDRRADVVPRLRHEHADGHDLVDRRVGRVPSARSRVEQDLAFDGSGEARGEGHPRIVEDAAGCPKAVLARMRQRCVAWGLAVRRWPPMATHCAGAGVSGVPCDESARQTVVRPPFPADSRARPTCPIACCARSTRRRSTTAAPSSRALGKTVLAGMKKVFKTDGAGRHLSGVGHGRVGSGARQHALPRRSRADGRDRAISRRCGTSSPQRLGLAVEFLPGDWRHGVVRRGDRGAPRRRSAARHQGRLRRAQRDVDRRDEPRGRRARGDRPRAAPGALHGRHDLARSLRSIIGTTSGASTSPSPDRRRA